MSFDFRELNEKWAELKSIINVSTLEIALKLALRTSFAPFTLLRKTQDPVVHV